MMVAVLVRDGDVVGACAGRRWEKMRRSGELLSFGAGG